MSEVKRAVQRARDGAWCLVDWIMAPVFFAGMTVLAWAPIEPFWLWALVTFVFIGGVLALWVTGLTAYWGDPDTKDYRPAWMDDYDGPDNPVRGERR